MDGYLRRPSTGGRSLAREVGAEGGGGGGDLGTVCLSSRLHCHSCKQTWAAAMKSQGPCCTYFTKVKAATDSCPRDRGDLVMTAL